MKRSKILHDFSKSFETNKFKRKGAVLYASRPGLVLEAVLEAKK